MLSVPSICFRALLLVLAVGFLPACGMYSFQPKAEVFGGYVGTDIVDLALSTSLREYAPGDCVAVKLQTLSSTGKPLFLRETTAFQWSGLRVTDRFFSDSKCLVGTEASDFSVQSGQSERVLYLRSSVVGNLAPQVLFGKTLTKGTSLSVKSIPRQLDFVSPMIIPAGFCSGPYELQLKDNYSNPVTMSQYEVLATSSKSNIYLDSACATGLVAGKIKIVNGNKATIYLRSDSVNSVGQLFSFASSDVNLSGVSRTVIVESVPYRLRISGGPSGDIVKLGACEATPYNVDLLNVEGNLVFPKSETHVALSFSAGAGDLKDACGTGSLSVKSVTFSTTENSKQVFLVPAARNSVAFQAVSSPLVSATRTLSVIGVPLSIALVGPSQITAGAVASPYSITLLDGLAAPIAAPAGGINLNVTGSIEPISDICSVSSCASPSAQISIPAGSTATSFYVRPGAQVENTTETLMVVPVDPSIGFAQQSIQILRRMPAKIRIAGGPTSGNVNITECDASAFTVELLDASNNAVTVPAGQSYTVSLGVQSGGGTFYANCGGAAITSLTFSAGQQIKNFSFKATVGGVAVLLASESLSRISNATLNVNVLIVPKLVTISGPVSITAGAVSGPYVVTLRDALGNSILAPAGGMAVTIGGALISSSTICPNLACAAPLAQTQIEDGSSSFSFYLRPDAALETFSDTLSVTPASLAISGAQHLVQVLRRAPQKLLVSGGPVSGEVKLAECNATPFKVELLDASGAAVTVASDQSYSINLGMQTGTGTYYSACGTAAISSLSFAAGEQSKNVFFKAGSSGALTLRVSDNASQLTASTLALVATSDAKQILLTGPTDVKAGVPSTAFRVAVTDAVGGEVATGAAISISLTSDALARGVFCSLNSCGSSSLITEITIPAGSSAANFYYLSDAAGDMNASIEAAPNNSFAAVNAAFSIKRNSLDPDPLTVAFGNRTTAFPSLSNGEVLASVQLGNKLVAAGYQSLAGVKRMAIAQYQWDANAAPNLGSLDTSFSEDGLATFSMGDESWISAVAVKDSKLLVTGVVKNPSTSGGDYDIVLFRVTADGLMDPTFRSTTVSLPADQYSTSLVVTADGYIYIGGYTTPTSPTVENTSDFLVLAFDSNGVPNGSFRVDFNSLADVAMAMAVMTVDSEERIVIAGAQNRVKTSDLAFARLHGRSNAGGALGSLDLSFQSTGKFTVDVEGEAGESLRALTILSTGQILGAGFRYSLTSSEAVFISLKGSDGSLDSGHGFDGKQILNLPDLNQEKIYSMVSNPLTDEIYLAGSSEQGMLLLRMSSPGGALIQKNFGGVTDVGKKVMLEAGTNKPILFGQSAGNFKGMRFLR